MKYKLKKFRVMENKKSWWTEKGLPGKADCKIISINLFYNGRENIPSAIKGVVENQANGIKNKSLNQQDIEDISLETIIKNLNEFNREMKIPYEEQINMICVLNKGVILPLEKNGLNNVRLMPNNNTVLCKTKGSMEDNLSLFYLILQYHLNLLVKAAPDLMEYAKKSNLINSQAIISLDDMDEDTFLQIDNSKISVKDMKNVQDFQKMLSQGEKFSDEEEERIIKETGNLFARIARENTKDK